jgi:eukaryotic-like serine/threonine-protein kinase
MDQSFKEEELFAAASALPAPERLRYLRRACAEDIGLFDRLRSLLEKLDDASRFIDEQSHVSHGGIQHIGPYVITQELGEGGCGIAYLAQQSAPIRRQVALKVIKPGMDTKAVIARFEAERQALAMMDHPNVAKVFDAGATSNGRPYFVLELVRGIKITDYCNQTRLSVGERLSVFIQVCQAIQHAHLKGIIHRDIKPSNVLVTMHDGEPVAKVIDFGIAKAMQGRLTDTTLHTVFGQFIGTPAYVSPEQTNPGSADIDTRSDLYSLGVLLYELLTGHTPFESTEESQAGLDALRRRIREYEPSTPSRRLGALSAEELARTASFCQSSGSRLIKEIRGDLDWIVMRCLEKERNRRYQTANDLILDLQRYLDYEPVLARPPSLVYVIRKFARRQRMMFAASLAGVGFVLSIAAFGVIASVQAQRIAAERERAEQQSARAEKVSKFMVQIFDAAQPFTSLGRDISARDVLDEAGRRIRSDLDEHPEVRAQLLEAIGRSYSMMGQFERATPFLLDSLRIQKELPNVDDTRIGSIVTEIAIALRESGRIDEADGYFSEALRVARRASDQRTEAHAQLLVDLGRLEKVRSNPKQALAHLNRALELMRAVKGPKDPEVGMVLNEICNTMFWSDDFESAERVAREAVEVFKSVPELHPNRVMADSFLGDALLYTGRLDEAALLYERTVSAQRQIYGPVNRWVADTLASLAEVRAAQNNVREAEKLIREALAAYHGSGSTAPFKIGHLQTMLATMLIKQTKFADAEQQLRDTLDLFALSLPLDHQYVASAEHYLGEALLGQRKFADAEPVLVAAMERWKRSGAPTWRSARSASALGEALRGQMRMQEAEAYLVDSFRQLNTDAGADEHSKRIARERVTRLYKDLRQPQKLDALLRDSTLLSAAGQ